MKVLITGTSSGVGRAAAEKFLSKGYNVVGFDIKPSTIKNEKYEHYIVDVRHPENFPEIEGIWYIVNNAGIVTPKAEAIAVNLQGYINIMEKYCSDKHLKSIVIVGSTASEKGYDNINYCASQGGRDALVKWASTNYGQDNRHVIVNGLRLDGIVPADPEKGIQGTTMEPALYEADGLMDKIKDLSILKRLTTVEEIAEWIYFLLVKNTCMTGQILNIDGELSNWNFIEYPGWDD